MTIKGTKLVYRCQRYDVQKILPVPMRGLVFLTPLDYTQWFYEEVYILDSDFYDDSYFYEYVESYWNTLITFRDLTYTDEIPAFVVDSFVTFMNECSKWANVSY